MAIDPNVLVGDQTDVKGAAFNSNPEDMPIFIEGLNKASALARQVDVDFTSSDETQIRIFNGADGFVAQGGHGNRKAIGTARFSKASIGTMTYANHYPVANQLIRNAVQDPRVAIQNDLFTQVALLMEAEATGYSRGDSSYVSNFDFVMKDLATGAGARKVDWDQASGLAGLKRAIIQAKQDNRAKYRSDSLLVSDAVENLVQLETASVTLEDETGAVTGKQVTQTPLFPDVQALAPGLDPGLTVNLPDPLNEAEVGDVVAVVYTGSLYKVRFREGLRFRVSADGVLADENGKVLISALQDNVSILQAEVDLGGGTPDSDGFTVVVRSA